MVLRLVHAGVMELVTSHYVCEGVDSLERHETQVLNLEYIKISGVVHQESAGGCALLGDVLSKR